jgi:hypothetical protein
MIVTRLVRVNRTACQGLSAERPAAPVEDPFPVTGGVVPRCGQEKLDHIGGAHLITLEIASAT